MKRDALCIVHRSEVFEPLKANQIHVLAHYNRHNRVILSCLSQPDSLEAPSLFSLPPEIHAAK